MTGQTLVRIHVECKMRYKGLINITMIGVTAKCFTQFSEPWRSLAGAASRPGP